MEEIRTHIGVNPLEIYPVGYLLNLKHIALSYKSNLKSKILFKNDISREECQNIFSY